VGLRQDGETQSHDWVQFGEIEFTSQIRLGTVHPTGIEFENLGEDRLGAMDVLHDHCQEFVLKG
jgi:hypothetical protein